MSDARKRRGRQSEHVVADYLRRNGFDHAEPVGAGRSGTDVTGTPGIDWEVKARRGLNLAGLLRQLDERAAQERLGVGVVRLDGQGPASVETWAAVLTLADLVALLRAAGYGTPHARPDDWTDPAPRVLPSLLAEARASVALDRDETHVVDDLADSFRCACGAPSLPGVTHSAAVCAGPETLGDSA